MTADVAPAYFSDEFAPVPDEVEALDLEVTGRLPDELAGRYLRNGPNPLPGTDPGHNFLGQGMLHGVRLVDGRAKWYRNRWVHTPLMDGVRPDHTDRLSALTCTTSNTSVLHHAGKILSLVENGLPWEVTADLDTVGPVDFGGKLRTAMTAHPKVDPLTGDLYLFGVGLRPPFLTFHHVTAAGDLVRSTEITVPGPTMMHDFAITRNHVVWLDLPVVFDPDLRTRPGMPFRWSDEYGARIGIMPRDGRDADVKWIDVEPGYAFHVANAKETTPGRIVVEGVRYTPSTFDRIWTGLGGEPSRSLAMTGSGANLYRWTLDVATGTVSEGAVDDLDIEFPTINDNRTGLTSDLVYAVTAPLLVDENNKPAIIKYDTANDTRDQWLLDPSWLPGEAEFVPAAGATREDDGWLLSITTHKSADAAALVVLAADNVSAGPVATVHLPRRVPLGFHGNWIQD
ncbi:carotenoid oxygenase family protein [Umezawaea endophytica]|uniref:Dioxygenase n=1 Tax=Umezawaea endophytica TaxID=1654476 RepID=A0A9X3AFS7_9PSEU|nr:carotenoid oxygenase family protein [Umezawaea endophytica]MCS7478711.1 carotenoid oxygenase family protein [Umezawaea endophytica]